MAEVMKEDDEKDDIVIIEDKAKMTPADDDQEDERAVQAEEDNAADDKERDAIRERRRKEKVERKERRDSAIKRDKTELDFLRGRNDDLERRLTAQEQRAYQGDISALDQSIAQAQHQAQLAEQVIAKAVNAGVGEDVTKAMRYRDEAQARLQQLAYVKQQAAQPRQAPAIDDRTMRHAQEFINEHPWYDAQGRDEDSSIVIAIDQAMGRDGYNPQTEEYWIELRKRAARRMPEKFNNNNKREDREDREERVARGGPAVGSGREHAPASTRKEVYISPERKQALVDAGVWEDPVLRMKYVKRYSEYDKQNRS